jgi:hypothetical protein
LRDLLGNLKELSKISFKRNFLVEDRKPIGLLKKSLRHKIFLEKIFERSLKSE